MNLLELDIVLRLKVIPNHSVHVALPIHIYGCYILKFYTLLGYINVMKAKTVK